MTKIGSSNQLPIQPADKFNATNKISYQSSNPYSSLSISSPTMNTNICSLTSLTAILFCVWLSMILVVQPIHCRTLVKEAIIKPPIPVVASGQKSNLVNVVKRNINDGLFTLENNNNGHVKPIEACQELLSAAILRNLAKNDLAQLEKSALLNARISNIFNDHLDGRLIKSDHKNSYVVHDDDNDDNGDELVDRHYLPLVNYKEKINETNCQFDYKSKQIIQCIKLLMTTSSRINIKPLFEHSSFNLNNLPPKKLSMTMKEKSLSDKTIAPEKNKVDSLWKQIDDIQQIKHDEEISELVNRNSEPIRNNLRKRVIFLLVNMSTIAPLIEKFFVHQQGGDSNRNDLFKLSSSYVQNSRPLQSKSFLDNFLKWKWNRDHPETLITTNGHFLDTLMELEHLDASSSLSYKLTKPELSKFSSSTDTTVNGSMPINSTAQQSRLVNTKTQELEVPRTKKILTKTMILHSDPWDKEGIRFKRSSEEELDRRGQKGQEQYISVFDIFGQEGIRFKKSPFDDEGIRYKKSPFDDEGIRYKKTPFDDEGIRYKKSPFDDEGIRYKKSSLFQDEHIRY